MANCNERVWQLIISHMRQLIIQFYGEIFPWADVLAVANNGNHSDYCYDYDYRSFI